MNRQPIGVNGVRGLCKELFEFLQTTFARVTPITPQTFRQGSITAGVLHAGLSDTLVAKIHGQKSLATLKHYARVNSLDRARCAMTLNDARTGSLSSSSKDPVTPQPAKPVNSPCVAVVPPVASPVPSFDLFGQGMQKFCTGSPVPFQMAMGLAMGLCKGSLETLDVDEEPKNPEPETKTPEPETKKPEPDPQKRTREISYDEITWRTLSPSPKVQKVVKDEGGDVSPWAKYIQKRKTDVLANQGKNLHCVCNLTLSAKKGGHVTCVACGLHLHCHCVSLVATKSQKTTCPTCVTMLDTFGCA